MGRPRILLATSLALALALLPGAVFARAGGGASMGSRGGFTFSAPPPTSVAPMGGLGVQRSMTARPEPSPGLASPGLVSPGLAPGYAPTMGGRSAFTSGLMGGLIGAGLGGLLFGHGMFGGLGGGMSFIGLLLQFALLFFAARWLLRLFTRGQPMFAGLGGAMRQGAPPQAGPRMAMGGSTRPPPLTITPADYTAFEQLLGAVQAAWSAQDLAGLRQVATPEMVSYFNEQLSELASRGVRNTVTDVRLQAGDLSQAWSEGSREYATVAMRFSMVDATRDAQGHVVDGSPTERQVVTELWTFLRNPGGRWILSAIQQTR